MHAYTCFSGIFNFSFSVLNGPLIFLWIFLLGHYHVPSQKALQVGYLKYVHVFLSTILLFGVKMSCLFYTGLVMFQPVQLLPSKDN